MKENSPYKKLQTACLAFLWAAGIVFAGPSGAVARTDGQAAAGFDPLTLPLLRGASDTIGDAPIAAFGECSHFMLTLHEFANDLFRYLVENKGFRVFMLEAAWAGNDYLMDFTRSDKAEIEPWMGLYLNAFDSPPTRKTLLYIREFNRLHPDDPIQIAGMQPEQPWTDWCELKATLAKAGVSLPAEITSLIDTVVFGGKTFKSDIEVVAYHGGLSRQRQRILSDEQVTALRRALDAIDVFLDANAGAIVRTSAASGLEEARLRVLGLRFYGLGVLPWRDFAVTNPHPSAAETARVTRAGYEMGDAFRFQIIKTQRETRFKGKKILIWMHSWHAARNSEEIQSTIPGQPPAGTTSVGTLLSHEYGSGYKVVHSVVAAPKDYVYKPGAETIERIFQGFFGDKPGYIDLARPTAAQAALPLDKMLPEYSQIDREFIDGIALQSQFDAAAYFPGSALTVKIR